MPCESGLGRAWEFPERRALSDLPACSEPVRTVAPDGDGMTSRTSTTPPRRLERRVRRLLPAVLTAAMLAAVVPAAACTPPPTTGRRTRPAGRRRGRSRRRRWRRSRAPRGCRASASRRATVAVGELVVGRTDDSARPAEPRRPRLREHAARARTGRTGPPRRVSAASGSTQVAPSSAAMARFDSSTSVTVSVRPRRRAARARRPPTWPRPEITMWRPATSSDGPVQGAQRGPMAANTPAAVASAGSPTPPWSGGRPQTWRVRSATMAMSSALVPTSSAVM